MTPAHILLRRTLGPLLVLAALAGVITAIVSARTNPGVDVALTLTVPSPTRPAAGRDVSGDAKETTFEALQSAELFAYTLSGWMTSPEFTAAVYRRAEITFPKTTVRRLSRAFAAVKRGGPVVDVSFRAQSDADGHALARALIAEMQARTAAFTAATGDSRFVVTASDPLVLAVRVSPFLRGLVAALVVGVLGVNLVLLKDVLRSPERLPTAS
ncbi:MAG: hypothetical protein G01um1014106_196 [Parcubacteria group bacterium Gr01-1014_106]|nr:MAG: hypothetical protein G01um1014106_196 [Parcubacteria group bacterium Gr01-1014_106]